MDTEIQPLLDSLEDAQLECRRLMNNSDSYDSYRRREKFNDALSSVKKANQKAKAKGTEELSKIEFENPFDSYEEFFLNEGWSVIDNVPNEMNTIKKFWEAVHGCAVAISELKYVETEPISDSRPYSQAGLCAKESLDNAIDNIKSI